MSAMEELYNFGADEVIFLLSFLNRDLRESGNASDNPKKWEECRTFDELTAKGREALIKYAEDHHRNNDKHRLEFWFKSEGVGELKNLLSPYLTGETQLPASDFKAMKGTDIETLLSHAEEIDHAISKMKDAMRTDLNECFRDFKVFLEKEYQGS